MEVRPGYKQTEVGVIPEDWDVSTVGHEFEIKLGKMLDAEKNIGVPKPYVGNKAVQWDRIDISELPTVPMSRSDIERFRLRKGDLLACEGGEVGRAAIWDAPIDECYYQKALHRLRPLRGYDSRLMVALLRQWSDRGVLANYVTQTSIAHLPREKFMEVPMPVPPPPEQRAIAAALSDVDALLGALDRLIAKKRDLKQAAMQQLLTGQTRLPDCSPASRKFKQTDVGMIPDNWDAKPLSAVLTKGRLGGNYTNQDAEAEFPLMKMGNIARGYFEMSKVQFIAPGVTPELTHRLVYGDVLLNTRNTLDLVGKVAIWRDELPIAYYNSNLMRLEFNPEQVCSNEYANYALNTENSVSRLRALATGTTSVAAVYTRDLMQFQVLIPPKSEQTAIATVLSDMDAELTALEQRRAKTRDLKQAMMQELLTGRTRLV